MMDDLIDFIGSSPGGTLKESKPVVLPREEQVVVNELTSVGPSGAEAMNLLEMEVDTLRSCVHELFREVKESREKVASNSSKCLMKPRDIPVLELRHLQGVEGAGRLEVFFTQVESCSVDNKERQQIVKMRVEAPLALFIHTILENEVPWPQFKKYLSQELTDQSEERLFDSLNDLKYSVEDDPVEFVTRLKCKLALVTVRTDAADVPSQDRLIKNKLVKGMPKDCRDRLELYMDEKVPLKRFLNKLDTERLVVLTRGESHNVHAVSPRPTPTHHPTQKLAAPRMATTAPSRATATLPPTNRLDAVEQRLRQWRGREKYCPYCRATNHSVAECYKRPQYGSCYDCLRLNCRRGHPSCPGRGNNTRNRML